MGNTLSCCVSPGASPTLSGRGGLRGQDQRQQERIEAYRVEAELREPEPSPGTNLQHISDREAPEDMNCESNPSDHPRASTIFLSKSQPDVREKRKSNHINHGTHCYMNRLLHMLSLLAHTITSFE
ncbi:hypothetical protein scyTo_0008035 [Scyliorhinus torazame]|uniref:Cyclin-Y n=1 Tax=Scyliorhinus torazame TaxID=75743 RepID=A0A401P2K2_SCYTO|nr:hypothetical protein [Scyliorhinus torazame]